jgi:hypothetical protein
MPMTRLSRKSCLSRFEHPSILGQPVFRQAVLCRQYRFERGGQFSIVAEFRERFDPHCLDCDPLLVVSCIRCCDFKPVDRVLEPRGLEGSLCALVCFDECPRGSDRACWLRAHQIRPVPVGRRLLWCDVQCDRRRLIWLFLGYPTFGGSLLLARRGNRNSVRGREGRQHQRQTQNCEPAHSPIPEHSRWCEPAMERGSRRPRDGVAPCPSRQPVAACPKARARSEAAEGREI